VNELIENGKAGVIFEWHKRRFEHEYVNGTEKSEKWKVKSEKWTVRKKWKVKSEKWKKSEKKVKRKFYEGLPPYKIDCLMLKTCIN
jgi:hypothetical protein